MPALALGAHGAFVFRGGLEVTSPRPLQTQQWEYRKTNLQLADIDFHLAGTVFPK